MIDNAKPSVASPTPLGKREALLLAVVLVAAHHALPVGLLRLLTAQRIHDALGPKGYADFWDSLSLIMPVLLCLGAPLRSGLRLGEWTGWAWKVLGICTVPVVLTAIIYPFTSQPFTDRNIGIWLISPAAQDLLFTGYLYGLLDAVFPGRVSQRLAVNKAVVITAAFFSAWHLPNFLGMHASYVVFQLCYTFVFGAWILLVRQLTDSLWPGLATHMAVNFLAWAGW